MAGLKGIIRQLFDYDGSNLFPKTIPEALASIHTDASGIRTIGELIPTEKPDSSNIEFVYRTGTTTGIDEGEFPEGHLKATKLSDVEGLLLNAKLSKTLEVTNEVGDATYGKVYDAGTLLEDIIRDMLTRNISVFDILKQDPSCIFTFNISNLSYPNEPILVGDEIELKASFNFNLGYFYPQAGYPSETFIDFHPDADPATHHINASYDTIQYGGYIKDTTTQIYFDTSVSYTISDETTTIYAQVTHGQSNNILKKSDGTLSDTSISSGTLSASHIINAPIYDISVANPSTTYSLDHTTPGPYYMGNEIEIWKTDGAVISGYVYPGDTGYTVNRFIDNNGDSHIVSSEGHIEILADVSFYIYDSSADTSTDITNNVSNGGHYLLTLNSPTYKLVTRVYWDDLNSSVYKSDRSASSVYIGPDYIDSSILITVVTEIYDVIITKSPSRENLGAVYTNITAQLYSDESLYPDEKARGNWVGDDISILYTARFSDGSFGPDEGYPTELFAELNGSCPAPADCRIDVSNNGIHKQHANNDAWISVGSTDYTILDSSLLSVWDNDASLASESNTFRMKFGYTDSSAIMHKSNGEISNIRINRDEFEPITLTIDASIDEDVACNLPSIRITGITSSTSSIRIDVSNGVYEFIVGDDQRMTFDGSLSYEYTDGIFYRTDYRVNASCPDTSYILHVSSRTGEQVYNIVHDPTTHIITFNNIPVPYDSSIDSSYDIFRLDVSYGQSTMIPQKLSTRPSGVYIDASVATSDPVYIYRRHKKPAYYWILNEDFFNTDDASLIHTIQDFKNMSSEYSWDCSGGIIPEEALAENTYTIEFNPTIMWGVDRYSLGTGPYMFVILPAEYNDVDVYVNGAIMSGIRFKKLKDSIPYDSDDDTEYSILIYENLAINGYKTEKVVFKK